MRRMVELTCMADREHKEIGGKEECNCKEELTERSRNDFQITLQIGSIVRVHSRMEDVSNHGVGRDRAKLVQIGCDPPGLYRALFWYGNDDTDKSV